MADILPFEARARESQAVRDFRSTAESLGVTGFLHSAEKIEAMRTAATAASRNAQHQRYRHRNGHVQSIDCGTMTRDGVRDRICVLLDKLNMAEDFNDDALFDDKLAELVELRTVQRQAITWRTIHGVPV